MLDTDLSNLTQISRATMMLLLFTFLFTLIRPEAVCEGKYERTKYAREYTIERERQREEEEENYLIVSRDI